MRKIMFLQIVMAFGDLIAYNRLLNTLFKHRGRKFDYCCLAKP